MQPQIVAAPHLKCYINNTLAGYVTGFSYTINTQHRSIEAIDNVQTQELAVSNYNIQASFSVISSRVLLGLEGAGVAVYADQLPRHKYLDIVLLDRVSERIVFQAINAVIETQSWTAQAKGLMTGQFTVKAIAFLSDPYVPDPNDTGNPGSEGV
jgi:hypothetical protein